MAAATRDLGIETRIEPLCHWLYFDKNAWYWRQLLGRSWQHVRQLTQLIRREQIELVYTNTSAIFEPALAARRAGVPHLWHIHEVLRPGNAMSQLFPLRWMQRMIRRHADQVVFESQAARAVFERTTPLRAAEVVYNSLRFDPQPVPAARLAETRTRWNLKPGRWTVLYVGQFIDRKNPQLVVDALARLPADLPVQACLIGEGPLEPALRAEIERQQLGERVQIIPFQEDIQPGVAGADVLVLPSRQESFGLVLVEAGALGKPVIACRCQGPCEIIRDGETGWLIDQEDPAGLAARLQQLIDSPTQACRMGAAAQRRVADCFSPEANTRQLEDLMHRLLRRPPTRMAPAPSLSIGIYTSRSVR
jgi:glycosyltransferase involved in cell wall biosynthesis